MASKEIKATATLYLDTKNAQGEAAKFVKDLKQKLSDIENAADKMTVFKDVVGYIGQMDKALADLKAKNADAFSKLSTDLDANLKKSMEMVLGVSSAEMNRLTAVRERIEMIVNSGSKTGHNNAFKEIASDINYLYKIMGHAENILDIDAFGGRGGFETKIQMLTDAVENFGTTFVDISDRIANSFGLEGAKNIGALGKKIQEEMKKIDDSVSVVDDMKKRLEAISSINVEYKGLNEIKTSLDDSAMSVDELLSKLSTLHNKINDRKGYDNDFEYYKDYLDYITTAKIAQKVDNKKEVQTFVNNSDEKSADAWLDSIGIIESFADVKSSVLRELDGLTATIKSRTGQIMHNVMQEISSGDRKSVV